MTEETKEEVVEETTQEQVEQIQEEKQPEIDLSKFKSKDDDSVVKVDLDKSPRQSDDIAEDLDLDNNKEEDPIIETTPVESEETPILEEVTEEEVDESLEDTVLEKETVEKVIPENIQKLMDFMEKTGGDLEDYVKLNQDYSELENEDLLREYYKKTKPHLNSEEIQFLMEDQFFVDEDIDDEREIKRKKLALKEQVANARAHLDGQKSKYYEDIKAGSKLTTEQQKAVDFFNRYNKESKVRTQTVDKNSKIFEQETNKLFNDKFKGFEYNIGDKKFRFNVKDVDNVKKVQSDANNFMSKFVDKKAALVDAKGYHKSIFTAMNSDAIANHFYEQGKADALKNSVAKSKNISMDPRQQHSGEINAGGVKVKVLGDDSNDFKFKIKNKQ
tara:strand:- start:146 stop:1306 length:1161 start_codon:yes stop_codon:yes gene_type:complete